MNRRRSDLLGRFTSPGAVLLFEEANQRKLSNLKDVMTTLGIKASDSEVQELFVQNEFDVQAVIKALLTRYTEPYT